MSASPARTHDRAAEVDPPELRIPERQNIIVERSERTVGTVFHAPVEGVDDSVLEIGFDMLDTDPACEEVGRIVEMADTHGQVDVFAELPTILPSTP